MSLLKNTAQPGKQDIFMKNGNESRDVQGNSQKRYLCLWAETAKRTNQIAGFITMPPEKK